ncbi:MAG: sugar phosphate nucleotidyltransferase [Chrysiogenales bacterium]
MIAVILAGGVGARLQPYTISLPKPLMPVGNHPILEILVKQLKKAGIKKIIIAVGYLESLIRAYFGDGAKFGVEIEYSSETKPLGTAGPLRLISDKLPRTFLFLNGDILTDLNFSTMLEYHKKSKAVATIGLAKRKVDIDFGVIEIDGNGSFSKWKEKPTIEYLVSAGTYILEPEVIRSIPDGFFNIPDLIVKLKRETKKVACYIHEGFWLDIGRLEDYQEACRLVSEKGKKFV